jgi:hypothetical protein
VLTYARQRNSIEVWQHQRRPSNQYQSNAVKEKVYVDLSPYWPSGKSIASVYEQLLLEGNKIDRRTLSSAKSGLLTKSEFATLVKLRDWVRKETGRSDLAIDDLLRFEPEEDK